MPGHTEGERAVAARADTHLSAGAPTAHPTSSDALPTTGIEAPGRDGPTTDLGAGRAAPAAAPAPGEAVGTRIGPYKLLQQIGEGGFGSVFMAEQEKPVSRRVALKIIKLGMDTRQVVARFEQERQALAMMDHPNIARVLDAGATDTGRPYFVMELCKGQPITAFCDGITLSIPERLALFAQVCQAVQHAHQKGLIHRDIKPSNILVSMQDGRPFAKVIDFGIAKATASKLTEKTLFTEHQQLIGTPEYMSPEQAQGSLDIDTRTDVYALGVLLYELVTGSTPFSGTELRSAAYNEIQRIIREVDPPKPSTRLSRSTATISSIAATRRTEPAKLGATVRGELDWIVMKAMEKDRQRRYETANGLAMDVQRYLAGEVVLAAPPGAGYHLRKFVRRHRAAVAGAAVVACALVLGLAGTLWQARVAAAQRDAAIAAEKRAEENFQIAREAVDKYLERVSDSPALKARGLETLRLQLLGTAKEFYEGFVRQRADDPSLRGDLGDAQISLANIHRLVAATDQAEAAGIKARELFEGLVRENPAEPRYRRQLAVAWANLGLLYSDTRRVKEAEEAFRSAQAVERELAGIAKATPADRARESNAADNLGLFYKNTGRIPDAEAAHKRAMSIREELVRDDATNEAYQNDLMHSYNNLTDLYAATGRAADAEPMLKRAIEICADLIRQHPDSPDYQNGLGASLNNLAGVYMLMGRMDAAREAYQRSVPIRERLAAEHPSMLDYALHLGSAYTNLGELETREGKAAEALPWFDKSIGTLEGVLRREPRHTTARYYLSYTRSWKARALGLRSDWGAAIEEWDRAIALDDRQDVDLRVGRAAAMARAGRRAEAAHEADEAAAKPSLAPETLYALAEVESLCSEIAGEDGAGLPADREKLLGERQARAVQLLRRAAAAGYFKGPRLAAEMQNNAAFASLRARDDFQELASTIHAAADKP